jgi:hypothetical protein
MIAISIVFLIIAIAFLFLYFSIPSLDPEGYGPNSAKPIVGLISAGFLIASAIAAFYR